MITVCFVAFVKLYVYEVITKSFYLLQDLTAYLLYNSRAVITLMWGVHSSDQRATTSMVRTSTFYTSTGLNINKKSWIVEQFRIFSALLINRSILQFIVEVWSMVFQISSKVQQMCWSIELCVVYLLHSSIKLLLNYRVKL